MDLTDGLLAGVTALSGAVGVLYHNLKTRIELTDKRLAECERDRRALWIAIVRLGGTKPPEVSSTRNAQSK